MEQVLWKRSKKKLRVIVLHFRSIVFFETSELIWRHLCILHLFFVCFGVSFPFVFLYLAYVGSFWRCTTHLITTRLDNLFLISSLFSYLFNTKGTGYFKAQEYGNCHVQFYQHYLIFSQIYVITFPAEHARLAN